MSFVCDTVLRRQFSYTVGIKQYRAIEFEQKPFENR